MLEKIFFFVGEAPPSMLWNVPGTVLAACRQLPGVHAYIFVLPIFRFQRTPGFSCPFFGLRERRRERWNSSPALRNHVISVYGRRQARTESGRLVYGRQAESGLATRAHPSGMVN